DCKRIQMRNPDIEAITPRVLNDHVIPAFCEITGVSACKNVLEGAVALHRRGSRMVIIRAEDPDLDGSRRSRCNPANPIVVTRGKGGAGWLYSERGSPQHDGCRGEPDAGEVSLALRLCSGVNRVAAGIKTPADVGSVPLVGPGVVGLDVHAGEGRRVAVLHQGGHVREPDAVGRPPARSLPRRRR
ncbi:MAG: hypothetical protein XE11_2846, partial [Methanomicrobiales archaeon 53_19]